MVGDQVDIPPTVIVHNFYYTGDRDFRGPVFPGGPSIVVVEHPLTGDRMYLDVQFLPGSPRIVYRRTHIDYHIRSQRLRIQFANPLHPTRPCEPVVRYCEPDEDLREGAEQQPGQLVSWIRRTGIPEHLHSAAHGTKAFLNHSADGIRKTGEVVTAPVKGLARSTMLGSLLEHSPEAEARLQQETSAARARAEQQDLDRFVPALQ